jgi:chromosome segregation ATPase
MNLDEEVKDLKNEVENLNKRVRLLEDMRINHLKNLLALSGDVEEVSEEDKNLQEQIDRIEALRRS